MGLSQLSEECRRCPFKDKCDHKKMEALAYLPDPILSNAAEACSASMTQPILRETMTVHIDGKDVMVYKDDIQKELYKSLYLHLGLNYMA